MAGNVDLCMYAPPLPDWRGGLTAAGQLALMQARWLPRRQRRRFCLQCSAVWRLLSWGRVCCRQPSRCPTSGSPAMPR